jgi:hypothetical protein
VPKQHEASLGDGSTVQVCCRLGNSGSSQGYSLRDLQAVVQLCDHRESARVLELGRFFAGLS